MDIQYLVLLYTFRLGVQESMLGVALVDRSGRKRNEEVSVWMTKKGLWNKNLLLILSIFFLSTRKSNM